VSDESQRSEHSHNYLADRVAFVVYGTIAVLAAVGGLSLESAALKAPEAAAVLIVVAVAAALGHSLWRVVRARARQQPEPEGSHEVHELLRSWPIVAAGLPETIAMVLALGVWSVSTGLRVAEGLGIAVLLVAGLLTGRMAGATRLRQLGYVLALPAVGLLIVALEVAAHHA
jgi:hypothetical protein